MWENQHKEADSTAAPVKSASGSRRWDVGSSEANAKLAPNKRRWDQDTPQEPDRKKLDPSQLSEADTSRLTEKLPSWKNPGKIAITIGSTSSKKTIHSSSGISSTSDDQSNNSAEKVGFSLGVKKNKATPAPIKMSLGLQKPKEAPVTVPKTKLSAAAANAFNEDDSDDDEEMPPEAKMRMKNIGRDTPTAAGPNSFGKGRLGFCDRQKIIQKELEKAADDP